jgi:hypothetical protein
MNIDEQNKADFVAADIQDSLYLIVVSSML